KDQPMSGAVMSEFPTTMAAANAARDAGLLVAGGAPNLVRGGSHSGNAAVADMARAGALDAICSDYVPAAMLAAAFRLTAPDIGWSLPRAIATVSLGPARAAKLDDRGALAVGLAADMARARMVDGRPHVVAVWRGGRRVA
ncbi:MAG: amidohydrolase family protein, partial [Alphaproteobacteria bacterium]